jgi:transposase
MKPPLSVRSLTNAERDALKAGLRSSDAFTLRRSQIILASAGGETPPAIARHLGCASQTVRNAIRAFNQHGVAALQEGSHRTHTSRRVFDAVALEHLRALAHQSPRLFGHPTGLWTLDLLARESVRQGVIAGPVSGQTIRMSLRRLGTSWKRAKRWITSPDPEYVRKKGAATG